MNNQTEVNDKKHVEGQSRLNVGLDAIAYMIYLSTWTNENESIENFDDALLQKLYAKWIDNWLPAKHEAHCGDCIGIAASCLRCNVEQIYTDAERIIKASNVELTSLPLTEGENSNDK